LQAEKKRKQRTEKKKESRNSEKGKGNKNQMRTCAAKGKRLDLTRDYSKGGKNKEVKPRRIESASEKLCKKRAPSETLHREKKGKNQTSRGTRGII